MQNNLDQLIRAQHEVIYLYIRRQVNNNLRIRFSYIYFSDFIWWMKLINSLMGLVLGQQV